MSVITKPASELPELSLSNPMIGDRSAMTAAWERDGYWLFRDVLDPCALARLQRAYRDEIIAMGIADQSEEGPVFNGKSLAETAPDVINDGFSGLRLKRQ